MEKTVDRTDLWQIFRTSIYFPSEIGVFLRSFQSSLLVVVLVHMFVKFSKFLCYHETGFGSSIDFETDSK